MDRATDEHPGVKAGRLIGLWLTGLFLPPALLYAFITGYGVIDVARTGICSAEPTDIPEHACTVAYYLREHLLGVWDLAGMTVLTAAWGLLFVCGSIAHVGWRKAKREGKAWGFALAGVGLLGGSGVIACAAPVYGPGAVLRVTLALLLFASLVLAMPLATRRFGAFKAACAAVALLPVLFVAGFFILRL
jgi:hypothetical protein